MHSSPGKKKDRKAVFGWVMYDWANSSFATTVMAGSFPIFFKDYFSTNSLKWKISFIVFSPLKK